MEPANARRIVIDMALRRQRPGSGSLLHELEQRMEVMEWWRTADQALRGIPHVVIGGVAGNSYMAPRVTYDLDVAVLPRDLRAAEMALEQADWRRMGPLSPIDPDLEGHAWRAPGGQELDLMAMRHPWAEEAIADSRLEPRTGLTTIALRYLILLKLRVSRTTDLADLSRMLGAASDEDLAAIRDIVQRFGGSDDEQDVESLLALGKLERSSDAAR
jgi:hypothetical protein